MHYFTLWCRENLEDFSQITFSNAFYLMTIFLYRFIFSAVCPYGAKKQYISISKGNTFVLIICANAGLVYWYMHASFRQNELRYATQTFMHMGRLHICSRICNKTVVNCSSVFDSGRRTGSYDKHVDCFRWRFMPLSLAYQLTIVVARQHMVCKQAWQKIMK